MTPGYSKSFPNTLVLMTTLCPAIQTHWGFKPPSNLNARSKPCCPRTHTRVRIPRISVRSRRGCLQHSSKIMMVADRILHFLFIRYWYLVGEGKLTRSWFNFSQTLSTSRKLISGSGNNRDAASECWRKGQGRATDQTPGKKMCLERKEEPMASNSKHLEGRNRLQLFVKPQAGLPPRT